jgi:hypothetical protein
MVYFDLVVMLNISFIPTIEFPYSTGDPLLLMPSPMSWQLSFIGRCPVAGEPSEHWIIIWPAEHSLDTNLTVNGARKFHNPQWLHFSDDLVNTNLSHYLVIFEWGRLIYSQFPEGRSYAPKDNAENKEPSHWHDWFHKQKENKWFNDSKLDHSHPGRDCIWWLSQRSQSCDHQHSISLLRFVTNQLQPLGLTILSLWQRLLMRVNRIDALNMRRQYATQLVPLGRCPAQCDEECSQRGHRCDCAVEWSPSLPAVIAVP